MKFLIVFLLILKIILQFNSLLNFGKNTHFYLLFKNANSLHLNILFFYKKSYFAIICKKL